MMASVAMSPELCKGNGRRIFLLTDQFKFRGQKNHHNILTQFFIFTGNKSGFDKKGDA